MANNTYKYLLSDIKKLKGVGFKTAQLLKKKRLILYLIYYGDCQKLIRIDQNPQKLKILKLVKYKQLL